MDQLYIEILNILGLTIENSTGRLYDLDADAFLIFDNSYIYTNASVIYHKRDTYFDPIHNAKLAEYLFNVLVKKETEENGLYVQMISIVEDQNSTPPAIKRAIYVKSFDGDVQSHFYYNISLAYIQLIYHFSGTPLNFDLFSFDFKLKDLEKMYKKR